MLFAPGGVVQETGASNVVLLDGDDVLTPALTDAYLHGVTRDSLLRLAQSLGWRVTERELTVADCVEWAARPGAEVALTGTAAVVAAVGTLVVDGVAHPVGATGTSPRTDHLRADPARHPGRPHHVRLVDRRPGRSANFPRWRQDPWPSA